MKGDGPISDVQSWLLEGDVATAQQATKLHGKVKSNKENVIKRRANNSNNGAYDIDAFSFEKLTPMGAQSKLKKSLSPSSCSSSGEGNFALNKVQQKFKQVLFYRMTLWMLG